jgi:hypothetical protein
MGGCHIVAISCVFLRRGRKRGSASIEFSTSKSPPPGIDKESSSKASAPPIGPKKKSDGTGEVTSPTKKAPRARKPTAAKKGSGANLDQPGNWLTGQKRKQVKVV